MVSNTESRADSPPTYPYAPFPAKDIKILLVENVHNRGVEILQGNGYTVESLKKGLSEDELCEKIKDVHIIGLRSKTQITKKVLDSAKKLMAIGCFCIGTNQVDLVEAEKRGIPVFNSPFQSTRSVAELVIGEMICLSRKISDRTMEMHRGMWNKTGEGSVEIRGKVLGIIGYGHIGSSVSVLAEALGMQVIFYDVEAKLPYGNARAKKTLDELMAESDYVTLHVPLLESTKMMIKEHHIRKMKKGAYLINASRGMVVEIDALAAALKDGHLGGAAIDVFPEEPAANGEGFKTALQGLNNVIMTPHIGGSTAQAQEAIAVEVSNRINNLVSHGFTAGAVNFPEVDFSSHGDAHRIVCVHRNVPGVLRDINNILGNYNVIRQNLQTSNNVGYVLVDVDHDISIEVFKEVKALPTVLRARLLH